jgi:hypothetical protein
MGFQAWNHLFDGPYPLPEYLKPKPGVYIVWCVIGGEWNVLDAGGADNIRTFLLIKRPFDSYPGIEPAMLYFSASYLANPKTRQALLERIKGPSFVPCDYRARISRLGKTEHEKLFGSAKTKRSRALSLEKTPTTPRVPKQSIRGLLKKIRFLGGGTATRKPSEER